MDPFSIVAAATKAAAMAWDVGFALYTLIEDTDKINQTIRNLHSSTIQLSTICDVTAKHVRYLRGSTDRDDLQILRGIELLLSRCYVTMHDLDREIAPMRRESEHWGGQAIRTMKSYLSEKRIKTYLESIESCVSQLSHFQIILIGRDLRSDHAPRRQSLAAQYPAGRRQVYPAQAASPGGSSQSMNSISSGGSGQNGATLSPINTNEQQDTINRLLREAGTMVSEELCSPDEIWDFDSLAFSPQLVNENGYDRRTSDPATQTARAALAEGCIQFQRGSFEEARSELKRALQEINSLYTRWPGKTVDTTGVLYKLAICSYHLDDVQTAEASLRELMKRPPRSPLEARESCHASHLLALIYARTNRLDDAASTCEVVYWKIRIIFGGDHRTCHESLTLLAICYDRLQQPFKAKSCRELIPLKVQERLRYKILLAFYYPRRQSVKDVKIDYLPGKPRNLCWSANNAYLSWQHSDFDISVYSTVMGHRHEIHSDSIKIDAFALSPSGSHVATASTVHHHMLKRSSVSIYDVQTGQCIQTFRPKDIHATITGLDFSPNETCIAYADGDHLIEFNTVSAEHQLSHKKPSIKIREQYGRPRFSPSGVELAICHTNGLYIHNAGTTQPVQCLKHESDNRIGGWAYAPDESIIAIAVTVEKVRQYRLSNRREVFEDMTDLMPYTRLQADEQDLAYLPNNRLLLARCETGKGLVAYDVGYCGFGDGMLLENSSTGFDHLTFSKDGTLLAAVSKSGAFIKIWNMERVVERF